MSTHRERILDQFTQQAVPFSTAPAIKDERALALLVEVSGAGPDDTVLDPGGRVVVCDLTSSDDPAKAAAFHRIEMLRDPPAATAPPATSSPRRSRPRDRRFPHGISAGTSSACRTPTGTSSSRRRSSSRRWSLEPQNLWDSTPFYPNP
ncbi:MAG: hypothetical protein FJ144_08545 [Deltaproteobacteria bacterium]|nr:hypothetical protein [Deltaproteobacteria bacterium]